MKLKALSSLEVRERRKAIREKSLKTTIIYKNDRRVNGTRICAVCQRPLSAVVLSTGDRLAIRDHYSCSFGELVVLNMCLNSTSCQYIHKKRREEQETDE